MIRIPQSGSKYAAVGAGLLAILVIYGCGSAPRETHSRHAGAGRTTQVRRQARQPRRQRTDLGMSGVLSRRQFADPTNARGRDRRLAASWSAVVDGRPERAARRSRPLATATFAAHSKTPTARPERSTPP